MRIQKSLKNMVYGQMYQFLNIGLGFLTRMILVRELGNGALSLNGLFTEIIAVLSLTELGVGNAIVYNLYKPLAENDREKVCQLMNLFRTAYRLIALAMLAIGLLVLPFIQHLISNAEYDMSYLRIVYVLFLLRTCSSYLYSYKASLFTADQKQYLTSVTGSVFRIITVVVNIGVLLLTHNYIVYLVTDILIGLGNNIAISRIADREYPYINQKNPLPAEERKKVLANVKYLFIGSLSGKITTSTDNILISVLVGTLQVGLYSNYSLIINNVRTVLLQMLDAAQGSIGNLVSVESKEKCSQVLRRMTFMSYLAGSVCSSCLLCMCTPFIQLVFGESYVMSNVLLFSFVVNFFYYVTREPLWQFMKVSGLFAKDKNISMIGSTVNLIVSIILGVRWGIVGIMIGTTCTMIIQIVLKVRLLYTKFFYLDYWPFLRMHMEMLAVNTGIMCIDAVLCHWLPVSSLILRLMCCAVIALAVAVPVNTVFFFHKEEFHYSVHLGKELLKRRGRFE